MFPVVSVVGWHNVGKTTLVEDLVGRLKALGLMVATIKHAHLAPSLDQPGTDTYRYGQAGSDLVGLVSHDLMTLQQRTDETAELTQVLERVPSDVDIVIVEGYKRSTLPKFEVCEVGQPQPIARAPELLLTIERNGCQKQDVEAVLTVLGERGFLGISNSYNLKN